MYIFCDFIALSGKPEFQTQLSFWIIALPSSLRRTLGAEPLGSERHVIEMLKKTSLGSLYEKDSLYGVRALNHLLFLQPQRFCVACTVSDVHIDP